MPDNNVGTISPAFQAAYTAAGQHPVQPVQNVPAVPQQGSQAPQAPQQSQPAATAPPLTLNDGTQLDPSVVKVMQAIKNVETPGSKDPWNQPGDNGASLGAYQWNNGGKPLQPGQLPVNFVNAAKQFGLDPTDFSPANQNKVAYAQINAYKQQGLTPIEIDALWNGAHKDPTTGQYVHNNPQRLAQFQSALQQVVGQSQSVGQAPGATTAGVNQPAQPGQPNQPMSVGGFLGNTVKSGANLLAGIGEAALHPIQTVQNLGGAAVGGLEELGGQTTDNTAKFDALKNYFANRYGSVDNLIHTAYTDPVGLAGDIAAATGVGGAVLGAASRGAELAGLGARAVEAGGADFVAGANGVRSTASTGLAGRLQTASNALNFASTATNPLTPVVSGAMKLGSAGSGVFNEAVGQLLGQSPDTVQFIREHPEMVTDDALKNASRTGIADDVKAALDAKEATLGETGDAYRPLRNSAAFTEVAPDSLERLIERNSGLVVNQEGKLEDLGGARVTDPKDIRALQEFYDKWKPTFDTGELTANEFLNFRKFANKDLAKFGRELTSSKDLQVVGSGIYSDMNRLYRQNFPGLAEKDAEFSTQINDFNRLKKGILDKDGNLLDSAINKIANATGKGKDQQLARLEELVPGITLRLKALKVIEDINNSGIKVGAYTRSILQAGRTGAAIFGAATGNIQILAGAFAMDFVARPDTAVPIMRTLAKVRPELVAPIITTMAKYATVGNVANRASQTDTQPGMPPDTGEMPATDQTQ